jgi:hypothetical protein
MKYNSALSSVCQCVCITDFVIFPSRDVRVFFYEYCGGATIFLTSRVLIQLHLLLKQRRHHYHEGISLPVFCLKISRHTRFELMWYFIPALIPLRHCSVSNHFYPEFENAHSDKYCHISSNVTITVYTVNCYYDSLI